MDNNKRLIHFDYLRVFATICVIGIHASDVLVEGVNNWSSQGIYGGLVQSLVRAGLPVFFMLSGALLLNDKREVSLYDFYIKRLSKIVIPFFVYSFVYRFAALKLEIFSIAAIISSIKDIIEGPVHYHLWFVYSIVGLYILTPFIKVMVQNLTDKFLVSLISILLILKALQIYLPLFNMSLGIDLWFVDVWLIYYLIGYLLVRIDISKYKRYIYLSGIVAFFATFILRTLKYQTHTFDQGINMYILCTAVFVLFMNLKDKKITKNKTLNKIVQAISNESYGIYLIHAYVLSSLVNRKMNLTAVTGNYFISTPLVIFINLILSYILAFVINKLIADPLVKLFKLLFIKRVKTVSNNRAV